MTDARPGPGGATGELLVAVPTLGPGAAQDEDVVQLLLAALVMLDRPDRARVTILSVDGDRSGWPELAGLFPGETIDRVTVEGLSDPPVPGLVDGSHGAAYALLELLKSRRFAEVHCVDRRGVIYHAVQAKRLGVAFLDTAFAVHVVGGSVFRAEAEDRLLDDVHVLADDLLERGSLEWADAVVVHDRTAWRFWCERAGIDRPGDVFDLSAAEPAHGPPRPVLGGDTPDTDDALPPLVFYGPLGADGGLPLFCDTVERVLERTDRLREVVFVGAAGAVGSLDAVSYVRLRTAAWSVPVTVERGRSIADEVAFVAGLAGIVVCDTRRRESLRARLAAGLAVPLLRIVDVAGAGAGDLDSDNPAAAALAIADLAGHARTAAASARDLPGAWRNGRRTFPGLTGLAVERPLEPPDPPPRVTVCLTHFRRPGRLRAALDSLHGQSYANFDVVVVDDGSAKPDVAAELEQIRREIEPRGWRLVVQENRYLGAARNEAARRATGEYLLFMDDDNVAKPEELATLVAVAVRTGADIVTTFFDGFEGDEPPDEQSRPSVRFTPFGRLDPALGVFTNCFGDANALYRREAFERIGGFTEDYGITHEDWELFCRASLEGLTMVCVPVPLFWYRVDPGGMFRGERKQLHEAANRRRHVRPYVERLPYAQAKILQLAQGLAAELPPPPVAASASTEWGAPRPGGARVPYARVAVIVRTKDRPLLLRRAVRSVLEQTYGDWLLVIVNDGGSREAVDLALADFPEGLGGRVRVLHHPFPLGMQTASNAGIASCHSDFVAIHDDDDTWEPTFLARTVSHLDEHGWDARLGGVVTLSEVIIEDVDGDAPVARDQFVLNPDLEHLSLVDLAVENRFPPISLLVRRAAIDAIGPFDEAAGPLGDWDFHLRLLARFDVHVIREPLARYHHRSSSTTGVYGNSVHAQAATHRAKRAEILNRALRSRLQAAGDEGFADLLALGELERRLVARHHEESQRLHDYVWNVEQTINRIAARVGAGGEEHGRNLVVNGDFRLWPEPRTPVSGPDGRYTLHEIAPGVLLSFDGRSVSYRVERRSWTGGEDVPPGKAYLHLEHDGSTRGGSWFALDVGVTGLSGLAGRSVCVSGMARMRGAHRSIGVTGRYQLPDGREIDWPQSAAPIGERWRRWSATLRCSEVDPEDSRERGRSRLILKLPHDQPFELDLTDLQLELGGTPTPFEYRAAARQPRSAALRRRAGRLRRRLDSNLLGRKR